MFDYRYCTLLNPNDFLYKCVFPINFLKILFCVICIVIFIKKFNKNEHNYEIESALS